MRARTVLVTAGLLLTPAVPASGHAELVPHQLPPGTTSDVAIVVAHGCGDEDEWFSSDPLPDPPTTAVVLQVPVEVEMVPYEVEGWTVSVQPGEDGGTIRWEFDGPSGTTDTVALPLETRVPDLPTGTEVWMPVVQDCLGGEQLSWTEQGTVRGGDAVPALRFVVNPNAAPGDLRGIVDVDREAGTVADPVVRTSAWSRFGWPSLVALALGLAVITAVVARRRAAR